MSSKRIFVTSIGEVSDSDKEGVGTIRVENNRVYKYVQYNEMAGSVTATGGDGVSYKSNTQTEVTGDYSASDFIFAGVLADDITDTVTDGQFCWMQIQGYTTLNNAIESSNDSTPVASGVGTPIVIGDADKTLRRANDVVAGNTGNSAHFPHVGYSGNPVSGNAAFLTCSL